MPGKPRSPEFTNQSAVRAIPDQVSAELDGETIVLRLQNGIYYGLDGVATRIWQLIQEWCRIEDLVAALINEFDVEEGRCRHDVVAFLERLHDEGLLEVRP